VNAYCLNQKILPARISQTLSFFLVIIPFLSLSTLAMQCNGFITLSLIFEIRSKTLHSTGSQHDSSITDVIINAPSDSEFEMDLNNMESTVLFSNDEDENHLRSLPELEREAI
jgi:hypothetical protein